MDAIELWSIVAMLYGVGAIPTHLAMKYMGLGMPTWKRVVALGLWPVFINVLMVCDVVADAIGDVFGRK